MTPEKQNHSEPEDECALCGHSRHTHTDIEGNPIRCVWGDCKCKGFKEK